MWLKNKIKKLEKTLKINLKFCSCESFGGNIISRCDVIFEKEVCPNDRKSDCRCLQAMPKPIEKRQIIVRFVERCEQLRIRQGF